MARYVEPETIGYALLAYELALANRDPNLPVRYEAMRAALEQLVEKGLIHVLPGETV